MATPVPQKVLNWLYSVLTSDYHDVNRTYNDTAQALAQYPSLSPRTEVYTYENGASALLLQLSGTLPVTFRGAVYHFPVTLWMPYTYPREAPMVFVTPTQGMSVRPGQHVSGEGRVYHPYLAGWREFWDKSNTVDFLSILRDVFAKEPPAVSTQVRAPAASPRDAPSPPRVPPLPPELDRRAGPSVQAALQQPSRQSQLSPPPPPPRPHAGPGQAPHPPPLPPLPSQDIRPLRAQPGFENSMSRPLADAHPSMNGPPHASGGVDRSNPWDARGPYMHAQAHPPTQAPPYGSPMEAHPMHAHQMQGQAMGSPPAGPPQPHMPPQYHDPRFSSPTPVSLPGGHYQPHHSSPGPAPGYSPNNPPPPLTHSAQHPPLAQRQQAAPRPKPIEDLLSTPLSSSSTTTTATATGAFSDPSNASLPAPPIPPNPEKDALLRALGASLFERRHEALSQTREGTLPALRAQHDAMLRASAKVQAELDELEALDATLGSNERILAESMRRADAVIEDARRRQGADALPSGAGVDELLVAPSVLAQQLYRVVAEERAVDDTLFVLAKALDRGRIGLDAYLKQTRNLARERFLQKALLEKISRGMGLTSPSTLASTASESWRDLP